jgi:hypothetical protein
VEAVDAKLKSCPVDLTDNPRRKLLREGVLKKHGTTSAIKRTNERYLFLFSDLLLVTKAEKTRQGDKYLVKQCIPLAAARMTDLLHLPAYDSKPHSFLVEYELEGPQSVHLLADSDDEKDSWEQDLLLCVMRCHRAAIAANGGAADGDGDGDGDGGDSLASRGGHHRFLRGTLHSATLDNDVTVLRYLLGKVPATRKHHLKSA